MNESIDATCEVSSPPNVLSDTRLNPRPCMATPPPVAFKGTERVMRMTRPPGSSAASSHERTTLRLPRNGWRTLSSCPGASSVGVTSAACSTRLAPCLGHSGDEGLRRVTGVLTPPSADETKETSEGSDAREAGCRRSVRSPMWWAPGWSRCSRWGYTFMRGGTYEKLPSWMWPRNCMAPEPQRRPTISPLASVNLEHGAGPEGGGGGSGGVT